VDNCSHFQDFSYGNADVHRYSWLNHCYITPYSGAPILAIFQKLHFGNFSEDNDTIAQNNDIFRLTRFEIQR